MRILYPTCCASECEAVIQNSNQELDRDLHIPYSTLVGVVAKGNEDIFGLMLLVCTSKESVRVFGERNYRSGWICVDFYDNSWYIMTS